MSGARARARRARPDELPRILALRSAVFVEEQGVPAALEHDALDAIATHLVLDDGGVIVGTCRLVSRDGVTRLGRMAVARGRRGEGLGAALLAFAHEVAAAEGSGAMELHAQLTARPFYERSGYAAVGAGYEEAGIPHVTMRRSLVTR